MTEVIILARIKRKEEGEWTDRRDTRGLRFERRC